jgi:hypothetical protein
LDWLDLPIASVVSLPDDYEDIYSRTQAKFSIYAALPAHLHF